MIKKYQNDLIDLVYRVAEKTIFKDLSLKNLRAFVFIIEGTLDKEFYCDGYVDIVCPLVNKSLIRSEVEELEDCLKFEIEDNDDGKTAS